MRHHTQNNKCGYRGGDGGFWQNLMGKAKAKTSSSRLGKYLSNLRNRKDGSSVVPSYRQEQQYDDLPEPHYMSGQYGGRKKSLRSYKKRTKRTKRKSKKSKKRSQKRTKSKRSRKH